MNGKERGSGSGARGAGPGSVSGARRGTTAAYEGQRVEAGEIHLLGKEGCICSSWGRGRAGKRLLRGLGESEHQFSDTEKLSFLGM